MSSPRQEIIVVYGDTHLPYQHPDAISFLKEVKKLFKPTKWVHLGDELDFHAISYHESNPDLPSAGEELKRARELLKELYALHQSVSLIESNHGSLVYRKALSAGIPRDMIRNYGEFLHAPKGWHWHEKLILQLSSGASCLFVHGFNSNALRLAKSRGMCVCQGHYHTEMSIQYFHTGIMQNWAAQVPCLVDTKSRAFEYNKLDLLEPALGCLVIINGTPMLVPMLLNKEGRWVGRI